MIGWFTWEWTDLLIIVGAVMLVPQIAHAYMWANRKVNRWRNR